MDVCLLWVLSSRGFCDELIIRPEESYRLWWVVFDLETSRMRRPWTALGRSVTKKKHFEKTIEESQITLRWEDSSSEAWESSYFSCGTWSRSIWRHLSTDGRETVHPLHPPHRTFPFRVSLHSWEDKVASHTQQNLSGALGWNYQLQTDKRSGFNVWMKAKSVPNFLFAL